MQLHLMCGLEGYHICKLFIDQTHISVYIVFPLLRLESQLTINNLLPLYSVLLETKQNIKMLLQARYYIKSLYILQQLSIVHSLHSGANR